MLRLVLNKLLEDSFDNYQVLFNEYKYHIHIAHHLGSLYLLGANATRLESIYQVISKVLEVHVTSPNEITLANWHNYLGDQRFLKSYRDFFYEQLTSSGIRWREKFLEFLLDNEEKILIYCTMSGSAHPLIHIGYAFELDNLIIAAEALTITAARYDYLYDIVNKLKLPTSPKKSALEIFRDIHFDNQLPSFRSKTIDNIAMVIKNSTDLIMFHYNQWKIDRKNLRKIIEELTDLSIYLYGATHKCGEVEFDFDLLHLVASIHAIRIIYSYLNDQNVVQHLLLQYFYFTILVYVSKLRPEIHKSLIDNYAINVEKKNWDYVIDRTLNTKLAENAHLVQIIHSLKEAEIIYGSKNQFYLKTAIKTIENFNPDETWLSEPDDPRQIKINNKK